MAHEGEGGQGDERKEALHAGSERQPGPPVTDFIGFAAAWPSVSERLADVLRRRGIETETSSEVVQEVGLRALERLAGGRSFDSGDGFYRWARIVGVNLLTDRWRRQAPQSVELGDAEAPIVDIEALVQWRALLAEVVRRWPALPERERQALTALWADPTGETTKPSTQGMRRLRARKRLKRWTGGLPAGWRWRLRWLAELVPLGALSVGFLASTVLLTDGGSVQPVSVVTTIGVLPGRVDLRAEGPPTPSVPVRSVAVHSARAPLDAMPGRTPVVVVPKPVSGTTRVGVSENSPDKALLCVDSDVLDLCADKPQFIGRD